MNIGGVLRNFVVLLVGTGLGFGCVAQRPKENGVPFAEVPSATEYIFHGQVVSGPMNSPAPDAEVTLYGTNNARRALVADESGLFTFKLDEDFPWHTHIVARKDGQVSRYLYLYPEEDLNGELRLGEASMLTGRVTKEDGAPVAGAKIWIEAEKGYGTNFGEAVSDDQGHYTITGLAPGSYAVRLTHERYTLTRRDDPTAQNGPSVVLEAGRPASRDLDAIESAYISGNLIGPVGGPVAGQLIANGWDPWNHPLTQFKTDESGNFSGYLPPWPSERSFRIENATLGFGMLRLPPLRPGEHLDGLKVQLGGTMRLTGTVSGPNSEPVAGVRIGNALSDKSGHYDTGWIYLERMKPRLYVDVVPPGRSGFRSPPPHSMLTKDAAGNPVMYQNTFITVESVHGQSREVPVRLRPMKSRELRGLVEDEKGQPVAGATVLIYQGEAITEQWVADLVPRLPREPEPRRNNWSWTPPRGPAFLMARLQTDTKGHWESSVFPIPVNLDCSTPIVEPLNHTVAVVSAEMANTGLARVYLTSDPEGPVDIDVRLNPIGADEMINVAIQDRDGTPLAGIAWILNCDYGYILSDSDGVLTVPRIAPSIDLTLRDRHYCIQDVTTTGKIALAPEPENRPLGPYDYPAQRVRCHSGFGLGNEPLTTKIEWEQQWVELPFFDARQGGVVITVARCDA